MAKHEKVTRFSWDVPEHEFAEAEVKKLRAENERLKVVIEEQGKTIAALEKDLSRMDRMYDNSKDRSSEIIAEKDTYIGKLERAFLREVTR